MDDIKIANAPSKGSGPWKANWEYRWRKWTPRIVVWTIAGVIGLWLGTTGRPAAAHNQAVQPSTGSQASLADVFRWDILLAGKEAPAKQEQAKTTPARQFPLPNALRCALERPAEPVRAEFPKTLSGTRPRFAYALPAKPAGRWQVKWDERTARLEHAQKSLHAVLETVPSLTPANRKSIEAEVERACAQARSLRVNQAMPIPEPAELLLNVSKDWPEMPSPRLMP